MTWSKSKLNDVYNRANRLATTDIAFRNELLNNPAKAIERLTGEKFPESFTLKVIESDPAYSATFILPPMSYGELSDGELDKVAGGLETCGSDACSSKS